MNEHDLPVLSDELKELLATEAEIDGTSPVFEATLLSRVTESIAATAAGGSSFGAGSLLIVLAIAAGGVGAVIATTGDEPGLPEGSPPSASGTSVGTEESPVSGRSGPDVPAWFGDPSRSPRGIGGLVISGGKPMPGATVRLVSYATRAGLTMPREVSTDHAGRFDFGNLRASTYDISATRRGLGWGHRRVVTTNPNQDFDNLRIELSGCAHAFSGVVKDASGGIVAGASVSLTRGEGNDVTTIGMGTVSGEDGRYRLCAAPGEQSLITKAHGYGAVVTSASLRGETPMDLLLVLESSVHGFVRSDDGSPIAGARVWLGSTSSFGSRRSAPLVTATDQSGRFQFAGVAPGRHYLWAHSDIADGSVTFSVAPGEDTGTINITLEAKAQLRATVVGDDGPVSGAFVYLIQDGHRRGTLYADEGGRFKVDRAPHGARLQFRIRGYEVLSPKEVEAGTITETTLRVRPGTPAARLFGRVSFRGNAIADAVVSVVGHAHSTRTNDEGRYELRDLGDGRVTLVVRAERVGARLRSPSDLTLMAGEVRELDIALEATVGVGGTVVDRRGLPLSGLTIEYAASDGDRCEARTSNSGEFFCSMLLGGRSYLPIARRMNERGANVDLVGDSAEAIEVSTQGGVSHQRLVVDHKVASISGHIVGPVGEPVADVQIRAIPNRSGLTPQTAPWIGLPTAISGARGAFKLEVTSGQQYALHARSVGGAETFTSVRVDGDMTMNLVLNQSGAIEGSLVGFEPSPRMMVRRVGDTVEFFFPTISSESFKLEGLSPGTYAVLAASRRQAAGQLVTVRGGETESIALSPRSNAPLIVQVSEFLSHTPREGVQCKVTPYIKDAGIFDWGVIAPVTDVNGLARLDAPTGDIEVTCLPRGSRHTGGAKRLRLQTSGGEVLVPVVDRPDRRLVA